MEERRFALTELRVLRSGRGLTQEQLAERAGVKVSTIQKHERGGVMNDASLSFASPIADALGVPIEALFSPLLSKKVLESLISASPIVQPVEETP